MARTDHYRVGRAGLLLGFLGTLLSGIAFAAVPKKPSTDLDKKAFYRPELVISSANQRLDAVLERMPNRAAWEGFLARRSDATAWGTRAFIDPRGGTASNLLGPFPLIPGSGVGNRVTLQGVSQRLGRSVEQVDAAAVADAVRRFAADYKSLLGIDTTQLGATRATHVTPELWQVSIPQEYKGVPVRHGRLAATIKYGNLVLIGAETWGNVRIDTRPRLTAGQALTAGFRYAGGRTSADVVVRKPRLEIIPLAPREHQRGEAFAGPVGAGYRHMLAWTFVFKRLPDDSHWEVMVDARRGGVAAFQDINNYAEKHITGGVYPVTSTEICPTDGTCGTMQSNWPMPWADTGFASPNNFTNSAGVYNYSSGTATTTLTGKHVDVNDNCGTTSNSSSTGTISLGGANGDHDCTTGGGSAGNTASSRSAFYEVNKLAEQARGWLPGNTWLQGRLPANVNINSTCNAYWNGTSINFYRSGGGCRNTGELAGVFDHEWGHGLDDNDTNGSLSNSSEAYADIVAIYRLQSSCVGHGFFWTSDRGCGQTADGTGYNSNEAQTGSAHCDLDCSGVRDADYLKHNPNTPDTALGFVCNSCSSGTGPCGRQVHCAAAPSRQAAWDFVARDLQTSPFSLDSQTAFIVANKLFYQGSGNIGAWHACTCGSSSNGCGSTNGYMQWLAADDDNGSVSDGTPHMTALYNAFNRHGIACSTPTPTNSGCGSGPTAAATLTATAGNYQVGLSWTEVSGASRYWVFRTEGHAGCNFGKALIAEVTGTTYTDTQVANGRTYYYNVVAAGSSSACFGRVSNCANATPASSPDFTVSCNPSSLTIKQGESGTSTCTVTSSGGFNSSVDLDCTSLPSGASCSFSPDPVTPPSNGSVDSTLTLAVAGTTSTGDYSFQVRGVSGSLTRTAGMSLSVTSSTGGGAQTAVFDTALQAPKCGTVGSSCDTGTSLVLGRANLGPEPNQPNTINDSCADGTSGTFHSDESNDRIVVTTTDGSNFAAGKTVRIDATVWAWTTPSSDKLDLFYAADATSPAWTLITTLTPSVAGAQTLSATYTLPTGSLQAVRAQFRYQSTTAACSSGSYNDRDDLVFAVGTEPDTSAPTTSITSPAGGSTVSGTVNVTASASDNVGVTKVEFYIDGALVSTDTSSPYEHSWNTTAYADGSHSLQSKAYDAAGNVGTSATISVTVNNTLADLTAVYDSTLKAPKCATVGKSCDSGASLVLGRDGKGPEPNQPNTINNSCADGTSGTYHSDESNDRLKVTTTDGTALARGKTVRIEATVWAWSTYTADKLDLFYAPNASSPSWTLITTITPTKSGAQTLSANYTIPSSGTTLQAIRAQFRYQSTSAACSSGGYNDRDDLVFAVQ